MKAAFDHLQQILNQYQLLSPDAWHAYLSCCKYRKLDKGEILYDLDCCPTSFAFIHQGLMRAYVMDENGNEYNKNFFAEGRFPGAMSALLNNQVSQLAVQALEGCEVIEIDFAKFRAVLFQHTDLMKLQIHYLETHWLLEKEPKEIGYLQFEAKARYQAFLTSYQAILSRLPQYHIASFLGITATQLSRIKKDL